LSPFTEKGAVRIHFEEAGSGFPLLLIAGGALNSTISGLTRSSPFNPIDPDVPGWLFWTIFIVMALAAMAFIR
jgi:hypothetical protein